MNLIQLHMEKHWSKKRINAATYINLIANSMDNKATVLDISGGSGLLAQKLKEKECSIKITDFSINALRLAKQKEFECVAADSNYQLPFKNESFDCVICADSLQYLNVEFVLSEMKRTSKKYVIYAISNFFFWKTRLKHLLGQYYGREFVEQNNKRITLNLFDLAYGFQLAKNFHLDIVNWFVEARFPFSKWLSPKIISKIGKLRPHFLGGMFVFICEK